MVVYLTEFIKLEFW